MSDLHKKLKALRREQKIDLAAIEKRTKINLEYLKAIAVSYTHLTLQTICSV